MIGGKEIVSRIDNLLITRQEKRKNIAEAVGISPQSFTDWSKRNSIPADRKSVV